LEVPDQVTGKIVNRGLGTIPVKSGLLLPDFDFGFQALPFRQGDLARDAVDNYTLLELEELPDIPNERIARGQMP